MFLVYILVFSPEQTVPSQPPSIGGQFGGPGLLKYKGRGFDLDFLEGG
jgi:hypothetical protein